MGVPSEEMPSHHLQHVRTCILAALFELSVLMMAQWQERGKRSADDYILLDRLGRPPTSISSLLSSWR